MNEEIQQVKIAVTKLMTKENEEYVLKILDLLNKLIDNNE